MIAVCVMLKSVYLLNEALVKQEIRRQGYKSLSDFAENIGLHRNMLSYYFSSDKPVISDGLTRIISSLNLDLSEVLIKRDDKKKYTLKNISPLIESLYQKYPENIFVLFGSRARDTNEKYSDFDIGTFSDSVNFDYLDMLSIKSDFEDTVPFFVDLVNLNYSDSNFIDNIKKDWQLLSGKLSLWIKLNEKN